MHIEDLINENISKKMGIVMVAMYLTTKCEDFKFACIVGGLGALGAGYQCVVDFVKAWKNVQN